MPRVLLLLPTATFRTDAFVAAAENLGVEVTVGSERRNSLAGLNPTGLLTLDFEHPDRAARQAAAFAAEHPIDAVIAVDDQVVLAGAAICQTLGLRHNSLESVMVARDKHRMRHRLRDANVPQPEFTLARFGGDVAACAERVGFPCVVKPLGLAGSKGVIRADDARQLLAAVERLKRILADETERAGDQPTPAAERQTCANTPATDELSFLIEQFVDGPEVALEGILRDGQLEVLAVFDKPDPLDGPFFEETIYVTPSRLPTDTQRQISLRTQQATQALGLTEGPIHAELRNTAAGPVIIEVNARSIGGKCSRVLKFGTGWSLEELIICQALDVDTAWPSRQSQPAGVMMIPTPAAGVLREVRGLADAEDVAGIESVDIVAHSGQFLIPLPEGSIYLGFILARAQTVDRVESALRAAHDRLEFVIEPTSDASCASAVSATESETRATQSVCQSSDGIQQ